MVHQSVISTAKQKEDKEVKKNESALFKKRKTKQELQKLVIPSGSEVVVAVAPPPTKKTAMLDFD